MEVYITGDNIISALGFTTEENIAAVKRGESGLRYYEHYLQVQEPFMASLIEEGRLLDRTERLGISRKQYTRFEQIGILSVAFAAAGRDLSDKRTLFILSTTKGNVELLGEEGKGQNNREQLYLWHSAQEIARFFHNPNEALVVSNACISGVVAQIVAKRCLIAGVYDRVVVVGADVLSEFIVSGFQSFKALSSGLCRPFDIARCGLNLGEGAATLIFERGEKTKGQIILAAEGITNDANHISGPSRTGEGLYLALKKVMEGEECRNIDFLNAHGTATLYNDEMEAIAFERAGLQGVPVYSLKGYFGHTLGAAGVLETVVALCGLREGFLPSCKGFEKIGVSRELQVVTCLEQKKMRQCIKTASGFGGCNAAIRLKLG